MPMMIIKMMIGFVGSMAHEVRIFELYANVEGASTRGIIRTGTAATSMIRIFDLLVDVTCWSGSWLIEVSRWDVLQAGPDRSNCY